MWSCGSLPLSAAAGSQPTGYVIKVDAANRLLVHVRLAGVELACGRRGTQREGTTRREGPRAGDGAVNAAWKVRVTVLW